MSYSYFEVELRCPRCGATRAQSITTNVESEPGAVLRAGSALDVSATDLAISHYVARRPEPGEPLRILEQWRCASCGLESWAEIVVAGGRIRSMELAELDPAALDRVQFIADGLAELYQDRTGESLHIDDEVRPDWQQRLRPHLP